MQWQKSSVNFERKTRQRETGIVNIWMKCPRRMKTEILKGVLEYSGKAAIAKRLRAVLQKNTVT